MIQISSAQQAVSGTTAQSPQRYMGSDRARRLEEAKQERSKRQEKKQKADGSATPAVGRHANHLMCIGQIRHWTD